MSTLQQPARLADRAVRRLPARTPEVHVASALAVGQARVQLRGFGVHQVGGQGAGIEAEQGVGERAVPPVEAGQMEADQQLDQGVEQPVVRVEAPRAR